MANLNGKQKIVPDFRVLINGAPLSIDVEADLMTVIVHEDIVAPSMFTLKLSNWDIKQHKVTWSDDDTWFTMGNEVEIHMGYVNNLQKIMVGEITALEPEFCVSEFPTVVVRGYDRRHRLMRGRQTKTFIQMKDSEIASQLAIEARLTPKVEDTKVKLEYVLEHNQTHLEFLQERAQRIGYEVVVEEKTLFFRPHQNTDSPVLTLDIDKTDLMEFYPRLTTLPEVGQVNVRGWNPKEKAEIVGQAKAGDEGTTMGGSKTGPTVANVFGSSINTSVKQPVFSQAEADQIAIGYLKDMALEYITGEGTCVGRTDLRAGEVIKLQGIGQRFSGNYYVTSTTHTCLPRQGYRTRFTVRRNAT